MHPWEIADMNIAHALKKVQYWLQRTSRVLAIGEIGLDGSRMPCRRVADEGV
jgi:Tat protein secretion system quality control protein TatD with DNase activity